MLIESTFKPAWWLNNRHLQTIYPALFRKPPLPPEYRRQRITTPDNDFLDIDFCGSGSKPLVLILHGLTGSSKSTYVMGLQSALYGQGIRSAALNFRGCSGDPNNSALSYHSGETRDIHFVYQTLRAREPAVCMAAVGFSLGGNVLLKWLGEHGDTLDLKAAVAVSVPLVLSLCATRLDQGISRLYRENLLVELKEYIRTKREHLQQTGLTAHAERIHALGDISTINSFWQYDDQVVAKLYGFNNAHDYYQRSSSRQYLKSIAVPTLIIQAVDDPFMTPGVLPEVEETSAAVTLEFPDHGGHVGFIAGESPWQPVYWLEQRIPQFLADKFRT